MRLSQRELLSMHLAEILEQAGTLIVELRQRRRKSISFSRAELVRVLADAHHHRFGHQRLHRTGLGHPDDGVPISAAGLAHDTGHPEVDWRAVWRKYQVQ
jgi:hypothetical protein